MRIRIITRFKNEHFIEAREKAGFQTQLAMAKATSIPQATISAYECFRSYPRTTESRQRVEQATGKLFEEMFPQLYCDAVDKKLGRPIQRILTLRELPSWTQPRMLEQSPEDLYDIKEMKPRLMAALATLTEREQEVLRCRFGIGRRYEISLEEIAGQLDVSRERIRQIEAKALRKLKHPSRSRDLKPFAGPEQPPRIEARCPDCGYRAQSESAYFYHCLNILCDRQRWMKPEIVKRRKGEKDIEWEGVFFRRRFGFGIAGSYVKGKKRNPLSDPEKVKRAQQLMKDFSKKP